MPRERETYRPELEGILAFTGGKNLLTITDVATYLGKKREWCKEHFFGDAKNITATALAMKLAKDFAGKAVGS